MDNISEVCFYVIFYVCVRATVRVFKGWCRFNAHFFAHITHMPCIGDHEGKHDAKGANIFQKNGTWKQVALWDSCGSRFSRKCHAMAWQCEWTIVLRTLQRFYSLGCSVTPPPHFSFRRSHPPDFVHFNEKENLYVRSFKYFAFYALVRPKFFLRLIWIVFQGVSR